MNRRHNEDYYAALRRAELARWTADAVFYLAIIVALVAFMVWI